MEIGYSLIRAILGSFLMDDSSEFSNSDGRHNRDDVTSPICVVCLRSFFTIRRKVEISVSKSTFLDSGQTTFFPGLVLTQVFNILQNVFDHEGHSVRVAQQAHNVV